MTSKLGASITTGGTASDASMNVIAAPRPVNWYFASAYPAMELNVSDRNVVADARNSEFPTYRQKLIGPSTLSAGVSSVRRFVRLIVSLESWSIGGRKLYSLRTAGSLNVEQTSHANGASISIATSVSTAKRA